MKDFLLIAFSLQLVILMNGCQQINKVEAAKDIMVIDLTKGYDDNISFKLDDFANDIRLVRLETNEHSLIRNFHGHIGEKHIISVDHDKVLQFSADGKFIGIIAHRGKGPGEFTQIDAWDVDEKEQFFFYHDKTRNYISKYNLNSFKLEENIPFVAKGDLSNMVSINDTLLAILPGMFSKYGYLYFYQSTNGRITDGIKKEPIPHPGAWAGISPIFKKAAGNSIIFQPSESDTVFKITGSEMLPLLSLLVEKPKKIGDITTGAHVAFLHLDKNRVLLRKSGYETRITSESSSIKMLGFEYLTFNMNDNKTYGINSIHHNYLGIELSLPFISFPDDHQFVVQYQAVNFKNIIKEAIENGAVPESERDRVKQLYNEISENDNPILITGKCSFSESLASHAALK